MGETDTLGLKGCESSIAGNKDNERIGAFLSLTFDLQDQSDAAFLVSILHLHGVVPAVLLLGPDQGKNTHVAAQSDKMGECKSHTVREVHNHTKT